MTFKRYMKAGAMLAVAALGLTACGGDADTATTPTADAPAETTTAPAPADETTAPVEETTPADEPADDAVEIQYLHRLPDNEGMQLVQDVADQWNAENPDIQVTATKFAGEAGDMITKLEADINAGTGPCLAQLAYGEVPEMFTKGLVEDVTSEAEQYRDNFGGAFGMMSPGGVTVGLPQDNGPLVYYYNETAFNELGIEVPTNIEEFLAAAKTAAAEGKYIVNFIGDDTRDWLSAQAAAAGDSWFTAESDQWVVNTNGEGTQRVAAMWQDLLDNDATATHNRWGDEWTAAVNDGTLIGSIGAAWEAAFMLDGSATAGQWRVAQLPDFGAGQMSGPWGGSGVAVMKGCEHPAEAMAFNNWFNTQLDALASQGLVVAALGDVETPEAIKEAFGGQDVYAELAKANETMNDQFAYIPGWSTVAGPVGEAAAAAISGSGTVADIFTAAGEASVKALKDAGLPVQE